MIKEGYKLNGNEITAHLKRINAFIKQYQNGDKSNSTLLLSIEEKNQEFLDRLVNKHPNLTQGEKHLATLLRVNLSTKDIAMLTGTMPKTINMNRYRLRKSLDLSSEEDLNRYLKDI
jgi:DNA-binding CsgD family transcriptional regulator